MLLLLCVRVNYFRDSFGNVELNWPKLFQAFSVKFILIFYHECVHSIIPHQHMKKLCISSQNVEF